MEMNFTECFDLVKESFPGKPKLSLGGSMGTPKDVMREICSNIKVKPGEIAWDIGLGIAQFAAVLSVLTKQTVFTTETGKIILHQLLQAIHY